MRPRQHPPPVVHNTPRWWEEARVGAIGAWRALSEMGFREEVVLPWQLLHARKLEPVQMLWLAVVYIALLDLGMANGRVCPHNWATSHAWFTSSSEEVGSFVWVCHCLGYSRAAWLDAIKHLRCGKCGRPDIWTRPCYCGVRTKRCKPALHH